MKDEGKKTTEFYSATTIPASRTREPAPKVSSSKSIIALGSKASNCSPSCSGKPNPSPYGLLNPKLAAPTPNPRLRARSKEEYQEQD